MEKKEKLSKIINIVFFALILVADLVYMFVDANEYITKTIASVLFVLCGVFNIIMLYKLCDKKGFVKEWIMLFGLIFAMLGDIFLIDFFILGAGLFAVGHVFFLIYFCLLCKIKWLDVICALGLLSIAILLIFLYPNFDFNGMLPLIIAYAVIISLMLAKALSNFISNRTFAYFVVFLGAFLFYFSDLMLLFRIFANTGRIFSILCLITYYPAEFLLAYSILKIGKKR